MSGAGTAAPSMSIDEMAAALTERVDVLVAAIDGIQPTRTLGASCCEALTERLHQDELADLARGDGEVAHRTATDRMACSA